MGKKFDRSTEDVGNILALEHLNLTVPDQAIAARFYVSGLGFTRDPYMDFGVLNFNNMWVNVGDQQFHLPEGKPQRFRGHHRPDRTGPCATALAPRTRGQIVGRHAIRWEVRDDHIGVTCPWGNTLRCHAPDESMTLGIRYLDMEVPPKTTPGIARFYRDVFATPATDANGIAEVHMGTNQTLRFRRNRRQSTPTTATTSRSTSQTFPRRTLARRARPRSPKKPISINIVFRRSSIRTVAMPHPSNSSTRCAACGTRCMRETS